MSRTILLVTEHELSAADLAAVIDASGGAAGELTVTVAVPQHATAASTQSVIDGLEMDVAAGRGDEAVHLAQQQTDPSAVALADAEHVRDVVVAALTAAGATARGEVTPRHPVEALGDILDSSQVDEVVVMVQGHHLRGALHSDVAAKLQRRYDLPVVRVHSHG